jgi:hypothetical protein
MHEPDWLVWILAHWKPWEWPGHFMNWLESFHKMREARANANIAEAKEPNAIWEGKVAHMMDKIRIAQNEVQAEHPGKTLDFSNIQPGPDDDVQVFQEAMRRIKEKQQSKNYSP